MFANGLFWSGRRKKLNVYIQCHQSMKCARLSVSNVIYHKFSHGATFYMLNGKNVDVMLEFFFFLNENICCDPTLEPSRWDGSNGGSQNMFLWRNIANYPLIIPVIPSYLEHCTRLTLLYHLKNDIVTNEIWPIW